jgi:tetratricopeptide (TPR) repeat protein
MSPEQAANDVVDERSDQYALATVLYEMLAGEPPFTGATAQAIVARRLAEPARPIRPVRTTVPAPVEAAVLRALERVPADRFASVSEFATALRAPTAPPPPTRTRGLSGKRNVVVAASLVIAAAAVTPLVAHRLRTPAPSPEAQAAYRRGVLNYSKRTPIGATDAFSSFNAAIRIDSIYSEAWAALAKTYTQAYSRGFVLPGVARDAMPRLALSALDRSFAADPHNADLWIAKGIVLREIDPTDPAASFRAFQQAVRMDSTLAQAWQRLGGTMMDMGRSDDALAAFRKSVAVDPSYTEGLSFMALAHYWRRQYDSAAHWADSAVKVDESYLLARQAQGYIAVERGDFARAAAAFTAAERTTTDVEFANAIAEQALVAARAGRRSEARRLLMRAESLTAKFSPTVAHTAIYMAHPYAALGDRDSAIAWLRRYTPAADAHFQMHMRCDPPFDAIANDPRFRSLLSIPKPPPPHGC